MHWILVIQIFTQIWAYKYGPIFRRYEKRPKVWKNPPPSVTVPFLNGRKRSMADMQPINDIYDSYHSNYRDWNSAAQKYFNFMVNARGMDEDDFQWDI